MELHFVGNGVIYTVVSDIVMSLDMLMYER